MSLVLAEELDLDVRPEATSLVDFFVSGLYRVELSRDESTDSGAQIGVLRVDRRDARRFVFSGDLYATSVTVDSGDTLRVFPRALSRVHIASLAATQNDIDPLVTDFESTARDGQISLWCQPHSVSFDPLRLGLLSQQWKLVFVARSEGAFSLQVVDDRGMTVAEGRVHRISDLIRKCIIRMIHHPDSEVPRENGAGLTLESLFTSAGWTVTHSVEELKSTHRSRHTWSNAELLSILPEYVDDSDIENKWLALLFCVPELTDTQRGVMFDFGNAAHNRVPRQACAISSHWKVPDQSIWKSARGQRFGSVSSLYFRTAVHELLHVFAVGHPSDPSEVSFRQTTDSLISLVSQIPSDLPRTFSWGEARLLRHLPDIVSRPGGLTEGHSSPEDESSGKVSRTVRLTIEPICKAFPLGAPVRLRMVLENRGKRGVRIPERIGFSSDSVRFAVRTPSGETVHVCSNTAYDSVCESKMLKPGEMSEASATLFGGSFGPIFAEPGKYGIEVSVSTPFTQALKGSTSVLVSPANTRQQATLADRLLRCGEIQVLLATGKGDSEALQGMLRIVRRDRWLGPHFRYLAAKPFGKRFFDRAPSVARMAILANGAAVMTGQELLRAAEMLDEGTASGVRAFSSASRIHSTLRTSLAKTRMLRTTRHQIREILERVRRRLRT